MAETCLSFIKSILFFSMNHMWRQIDATCRESRGIVSQRGFALCGTTKVVNIL